jgi:hypothetical protein
MKKLVYTAVGAFAATAMAPAANAASFFLTLNAAPTAIPAQDNFFSTDLSGLSLGLIGLGQVSLDTAAVIDFEFMGTESGFHDTFRTTFLAGNLSFTEATNGVINNFLSGTNSPTFIGTRAFAAGNLAVEFTNNGNGVISAPGSLGFGTLLATGTSAVAGNVLNLGNVVYFAYDDQISPNDDDNHDDLIIRATISPVPEPATWALMLLGFGAVGYSLRRRPAYKMVQAV